MSIKIWTAWRIPRNRLEEATVLLDASLKESFYRQYSNLLNATVRGKDRDSLVESLMAFERKLADNQKAHTLDFNAFWQRGFYFFLDKRHAYILPQGAVEIPDWFEDYHYQDQVDRDESVPMREWNQRKRKWAKLWTCNPKPLQFRYDAVDPSEGFYMAFSPYSTRWLNEKLEGLKDNAIVQEVTA